MNIKQRARSVGEKMRPVGAFLKASFEEWTEDKALRHAAALAYYSIFSLAPLLVIGIAVAGFFFGEQAVKGEIVEQLQDFIGTEGAVFIENMIAQAGETGAGLWATIISVATMLFGALIIFSALQDVLNMIWGVEPEPDTGLGYTIRRRLLAFLMILVFGALMLGVLLASAALTLAQAYWEAWFGTEWEVWAFTDQVIWLVFFTGIFALIYKILPDVRMAWKDVWVGAIMTSVLFTVGVYAISVYIAYSGVGTIFGAAGTLAVILVWVYYSWTIVLVGAEMTQVWARRFGDGIRPGPKAMLRVDRTEHVKEGRVTAQGVETGPQIRVIDTEERRGGDGPRIIEVGGGDG